MSSCKIRNNNGCIKLEDSKKLNSDVCICYRSIAFDGCNFYATTPNLRSIAVFSRRFSRTGMIEVPEKYEFITYDSTLDVYWATISGNNTTLYQLDKSFNQTGTTITLPAATGCCLDIQGLSYCCCNDTLLVLRGGTLYQVPKTETGTITEIATSSTCERITSVVCMSPYIVIVYRKRGRDYIKATSCSNCSERCSKKLPKKVRILDLAVYRRRRNGKVVLCCIATKNNTCNYMFEVELKHLNPATCNFLTCPSCCCGQTAGASSGCAMNPTNPNYYTGCPNRTTQTPTPTPTPEQNGGGENADNTEGLDTNTRAMNISRLSNYDDRMMTDNTNNISPQPMQNNTTSKMQTSTAAPNSFSTSTCPYTD